MIIIYVAVGIALVLAIVIVVQALRVDVRDAIGKAAEDVAGEVVR